MGRHEAKITCTGYTNNRGSTQSYQRLGLARANAVCKFLEPVRRCRGATRVAACRGRIDRARAAVAGGRRRGRLHACGRWRRSRRGQRRRLPYVRDQDRRRPGVLGLRRLAAGGCRARTRRAARSPRSAPAPTIRARSRPPAAWSAGASTATGGCRARTRRAARSPRSAPAASHTCAIKTAGDAGVLGLTAASATGRCRARTRRAARSPRSAPAATIRARSRPPATLECWGSDEFGDGQVSGPNAEGGTFTQVSAGREHTCAIKTDGGLECWGYDGAGQVSGPNAEGGTFTQVSAGAAHTCAIKTDGDARVLGHRRRAGVGA